MMGNIDDGEAPNAPMHWMEKTKLTVVVGGNALSVTKSLTGVGALVGRGRGGKQLKFKTTA